MNKGIYIALSGAILKQRHMNVFTQNIANANTSGYKKERLAFKEYLMPADNRPAGIQDGRSMTELSKRIIDFSPGIIQQTGNPLDVAINGEGFFELEGEKYTRNGHFTINAEGDIVNQSGLKVMGEGGPITAMGGNVEISVSGDIFVDGISVGRLKVVDFPDREVLEKVGDGMFAADGTAEVVDASVSQGFLEGSNVNVIQEMIHMLTANREFETYQKMIRSFDDAASRTINEMGK